MSTPVPDSFKVVSLHRYFIWSIEMRQHYNQIGMKVSPTPSFWERENAGRAFMYLSYWYAALYVVCEGWRDLMLSDTEIDGLLNSPHLEILKRFRNGVYHYQPDYFDKRFINALIRGKPFDDWIEFVTGAFVRYFDAWVKSQTGSLVQNQP